MLTCLRTWATGSAAIPRSDRCPKRNPEHPAAWQTEPVTYLPPITTPIRTIGGRVFDFAHEIVVMGIVNRTPDSFYDAGLTFALDLAVEAGEREVADGAGWVDVGGVPFSPEVPTVSVVEELDRVVPVVARLADDGVVVSVDTVRPEVARAAIAAGAGVINDTSGLLRPGDRRRGRRLRGHLGDHP